MINAFYYKLLMKYNMCSQTFTLSRVVKFRNDSVSNLDGEK